MNSPAFDTLKAAKALEDAGFDQTQAEAVVATLREVVHEHTAPLADGIATFSERAATKESVSAVADNLAALTNTVATIADTMATREYVAMVTKDTATKESVNAAFAGLRAEVAAEFKALYRHLWVLATGIVGATVALTKLLS